MPVGPVAPEPVGPVLPVEPVLPVLPVTPVEPVEPPPTNCFQRPGALAPRPVAMTDGEDTASIENLSR
jgi:hypothetical protein